MKGYPEWTGHFRPVQNLPTLAVLSLMITSSPHCATASDTVHCHVNSWRLQAVGWYSDLLVAFRQYLSAMWREQLGTSSDRDVVPLLSIVCGPDRSGSLSMAFTPLFGGSHASSKPDLTPPLQ